MFGKLLFLSVLVFVNSCGHSSDDPIPNTTQKKTSDKVGEVNDQPHNSTTTTASNGESKAPSVSSPTNETSQGDATPPPTSTDVHTDTGSQNPVVNPGTTPANEILLASEPFRVSDLRQPRLMNQLRVETHAPAKVVKVFSLQADRNGFLEFDYEHKTMRDCHGGLTFDYRVTVRDVTTPVTGDRAVALRSCFPLVAQHQYQIEVAVVNSHICDTVGLEIGMVAQFACRQ